MALLSISRDLQTEYLREKESGKNNMKHSLVWFGFIAYQPLKVI